jgi:hypothetical protein
MNNASHENSLRVRNLLPLTQTSRTITGVTSRELRRLALWGPTIPTTFVWAFPFPSFHQTPLTIPENLPLRTRDVLSALYKALLHTPSTLRLPAGSRLAPGRSVRLSRPACADAAKSLQSVFSTRRHRTLGHGMPLPRSLRMVVHCYSRKDMSLPKYETELSCWESNRRSVVMTKQGEANRANADRL